MTFTYTISYNIEKDMWNWWDACNSTGHGVDWKDRIDRELAENIVGKTKDEAYGFLRQFLASKQEHEEAFKYGQVFIEERFRSNFEQACRKLEALTGKPLYRSNFAIDLTTFPRGPYDYKSGSLFLSVYWINPIANFMHEVLHFQFIHYWRQNAASSVSKLSNNQFETLKEALTVILDESQMPLIEKADSGYEAQRELRDTLHKFWVQHQDFSKLVDYGVEWVINGK